LALGVGLASNLLVSIKLKPTIGTQIKKTREIYLLNELELTKFSME
jgi:hypothetical protein